MRITNPSSRVLLLLGEVLEAYFLNKMLNELGHVVVSDCCILDEALHQPSFTKFDFAVLEVVSRGVRNDALAFELAAREVPFLLLANCEYAMDEIFKGVPIIAKPVTLSTLHVAIKDLASLDLKAIKLASLRHSLNFKDGSKTATWRPNIVEMQ